MQTVKCPCCGAEFPILETTERHIADGVLGEGKWEVNDIKPPPCSPQETMEVWHDEEADVQPQPPEPNQF